MIYTEQNDIGIISFNKSILNQLINVSVMPWSKSGKLKLVSKHFEVLEKGILVEMHISLAFGESTTEVVNHILDYLSDEIVNSLESQVYDIIVSIDTMFTSKGATAERNFRYSYREREFGRENY